MFQMWVIFRQCMNFASLVCAYEPQVWIRDKHINEAVFEGSKDNGFHKLSGFLTKLALSFSKSFASNHWHACFCHITLTISRKLPNTVNSLTTIGGSRHLCRPCVKGKQHWEPS